MRKDGRMLSLTKDILVYHQELTEIVKTRKTNFKLPNMRDLTGLWRQESLLKLIPILQAISNLQYRHLRG